MSERVDVAPTPPPSLARVGDVIEARVQRLLEAEIARWTLVDETLRAPLEALQSLVMAGGKRLRPAFCHWAYVGAGGDPADPTVVDVGAALELLHTFALVHDDVMDNADRRRGQPSVHAAAITTHGEQRWRGEDRRFGEGVAILVGDFAFVYADMLVAELAPEARALYDELRVELCVGQYLDLAATAAGGRDEAQARRIEWYKSGKYTVERPLHLGASLAGRGPELSAPLSAFGLPLGEAFQMRDDLLSVFGDPAVTGKPVGDDLREGKLTPLVAATARRADAAGLARLERIGAPDITGDEIAALQQTMIDCGAVAHVERAIEALVAESLDALTRAPITADARDALADLGAFVAWRDR
ncbi:MAG: polyprenyl synthetase family protein [Acidimicrobiia bacterium]